MLGILLFSFGVMYTPGPVNILSLNSGMQGRPWTHAPFCLGVAGGLCLWFMVAGYAGAAFVGGALMPVVAGLGVCFVLHLARKIMTAEVGGAPRGRAQAVLDFKDGLFMQLLNPKSFMVVLPVATVQFPAAGITGAGIALWSLLLAALGFGAPMAYALFGSTLARRVDARAWLKALNRVMGLMLAAVAADMAYEYIYLALAGG
jgi:threonine/homoserine/homoserine lactone efflux protein